MHLKFCAVFLLIFSCCGISADIFPKGEGASLVLGIIACPFKKEPFACLRSEIARALDVGDRGLKIQTEQLKVDADNDFEERIQSRAISTQEIPKQKPSAIIESYQNAIASLGDYISDQFDDDVKKRKKKTHKSKKSKNKLLRNKSHNLRTDCLDEDCDNGLAAPPVLYTDDSETNQNDWHQNDYNHNEKRTKKKHIKKKHIKKKHKKALLKIFIIGSLIKAKLSFLLKLVSLHLKIKIFGILIIGFILHIIRFVIGLKPKHETQEVIYYEHADHHHHYESRDKDLGGSGGYLKLALDASSFSKHKHRQERQYQPLEQWNTNVNLNIPMPRHLTDDSN